RLKLKQRKKAAVVKNSGFFVSWGKEEIWQKQKKWYFSVRTAVMSPQSGWGSAPDAGNGIPSWKNRFRRRRKAKGEQQEQGAARQSLCRSRKSRYRKKTG